MGFASVKSPAPIDSDVLAVIDLQLFADPFAVKTDESYASESAQAPEAPEDDGDGAAQDDDDQSQEPYNQDEDEAADDEAADPKSDQVEEQANEEDDTGSEAQANPSAPSQTGGLILGKFKDQAALEAAYEEAQRQLGRLHREIAEQRRQASQSPAPEQKPPEPKKTPEQIAKENRERLQAFLKNPIEYERELIRQAKEEALREVQQTQASISAREQTVIQGISMAASKFSDFAEVEAAVTSTLQTRPAFQRALMTLQNDPNATPEDVAALVEDAYHFAKAELAHAAVQAARDQGRREASAAQAQRKQAAVAGQRTRRDQTTETAEERIKREIKESGRSSGLWKL